MGHEVIALQENQTTTDVVVEACKNADVLQWTHTHTFRTSGSFSTDEMVKRIRDLGVKSFSYHLDLYWGLNQLDHREELIGKHPSWKLDYFFSTDGSEQPWAERAVNHVYMPPGIVEYATFYGSPKPQYQSEIGFIGSVGYHPEFLYRRRMVEGLQKHYGARFRVFSGIREKELNDLCASVKVLAGDHCFAGRPRYWSDRAPEQAGRGGFLVYPQTEGMCIPFATYEPQNLQDLIQKIDYYLANEEERIQIRDACFEHVKTHDTYTIRLQQILDYMGF